MYHYHHLNATKDVPELFVAAFPLDASSTNMFTCGPDGELSFLLDEIHAQMDDAIRSGCQAIQDQCNSLTGARPAWVSTPRARYHT